MSVQITYGELKRYETSEECAVCLEEYSNESVILNLTCKHFFHPDCIKSLTHCPSCRAQILRADGFYLYFLKFLDQNWPVQRGGWSEEEFGQFGWEVSTAINEHEEWTDYIPISSYKELKRLFSHQFTEHDDQSSDEEWKEILFQEFIDRPEIKPLFQEISGRFLAKMQKNRKISMIFRMVLSQNERNAVIAAEKFHPRPGFFEKCFPNFHLHQE